MIRDAAVGPRILSLFSGYGGLDMAVAGVLGGTVVAHAEVEPAACRLLAHHWPHVPNVGDVTAVNWRRDVGQVDVITGGFPCQDVSLAGRRLGIAHDTRSGLWGHMAAAVDVLRPSLVLIENVRGLLSARADHPAHSVLEPCPWCVGDDAGSPLRALGAVLGDLADLGYDAAWRMLSAADVGAPRRRERVFVVAWPAADPENDRRAPLVASGYAPQRSGVASGGPIAQDTDVATSDERRFAAPGEKGSGRARSDARGRSGAPAADPTGDGRHERRTEPARLLGGPDAPVGRASAVDPDGGGLRSVGRLASVGSDPDGCDGPHPDGRPTQPAAWGPYAAAVRRWEAVLGRPAPPPTETGRAADRLSPRFVEWMMGLPDGWVTGVPGVSRSEQLKLLGNGVVPQQAARALEALLHHVWAAQQHAALPPVVGEGAA